MNPPFDLEALWASEFEEHRRTVEATRDALQAPFARLVTACVKALQSGNALLFCGNGGSASDAQHLATEFAVRYTAHRRALRALALTTDTSVLTAIGNDYGFERVFARQVEAIGRPGDVLIGITTSGRSRNVVVALETAREMGLVAAALTGKAGGDLHGIADPLLVVPSQSTARIQEMHILLGQMLCRAVEHELGLVPWHLLPPD